MREHRTSDQLREHYLIEKELADRLRNAPKDQRRGLYRTVYDERSRRISHHPLVMRAADPVARERAAAPQLRLVRRFVTPQSTFLEIGAGDCSLALAMAPHVKQVFAVDVSKELVSDVQNPSNFEFRLFDGIEIDLPPSSIDLAYSSDVLEHLHPDDVAEQLTNVLHVLKPGGLYVCVTPNRLSGPHDISRHFDVVPTGFHLKEYTIGDLLTVFTAAGFSSVRTLVSVKGHVLSPMLPARGFTYIERSLTWLPRQMSKRLARVLTALKVVAVK